MADIEAKVKEIIDNEDKSDPLSDDEIVKRLSATTSVPIARRTVAKYRAILGIPFDPKFNDGSSADKLRSSLGIKAGIPTLLIMGGGQGMGLRVVVGGDEVERDAGCCGAC